MKKEHKKLLKEALAFQRKVGRVGELLQAEAVLPKGELTGFIIGPGFIQLAIHDSGDTSYGVIPITYLGLSVEEIVKLENEND